MASFIELVWHGFSSARDEQSVARKPISPSILIATYGISMHQSRYEGSSDRPFVVEDRVALHGGNVQGQFVGGESANLRAPLLSSPEAYRAFERDGLH